MAVPSMLLGAGSRLTRRLAPDQAALPHDQPEAPPQAGKDVPALEVGAAGKSGVRRVAAAWTTALVMPVAYLLLLWVFDVGASPSAKQFGTKDGNAQQLRVYLEPLAVDAVKQSVQIRVDFAPGAALRGPRPDVPARDLAVVLSNADTVQTRVFRANEPMTGDVLSLDLNEAVNRYPFDRYHAALRIQAFEGVIARPDAASRVLEAVTVWEAVLGFTVRTGEEPGSAPDDIRLRFDLRRTGAHTFFALAAYGTMVALACSALTIGLLVFLGQRKVEATMTGALGAIVFSMPVLRNVLPGAPPLGVWGDMAVFLWAELAAVISLSLFVLAWARHGARP